MAKKGFSVGKEALFKKIMPTNQETEDMTTADEITPAVEEFLPVEEPVQLEIAVPSVESIEDTSVESIVKESEPKNIEVEQKPGSVPEPKVVAGPEVNTEQETVLPVEEKPVVETTPVVEVQRQEMVPPISEPPKQVVTETADEMQQKNIVRPMIYGLPEDKQPYIQQQQTQQQLQQQPMMPPQMMPGQEIPMYPAPGYMQPPYPMGMQEQGAYGQMPPQGAGYQQQPYMPGYPPQYYPMVPSPYYHPNAAFATMYYATGQDGQPQPVILPQMVVDGAKLSLYDMLEDIPPIISSQEEVKEEKVEVKEEIPAVEDVVPEPRWKVINVVEHLVGDKVLEFMKRDKGICLCEKCQLDVIALALNKVAPHYITTDNYSRALMDLYYQERKVDIMVAIFEAIDIVKANPRHDDL